MSALAELKNLVHSFPGQMSVSAVRHDNGARVGLNDHSPFYLASASKVAILAALIDVWPTTDESSFERFAVQMHRHDYRSEGYFLSDRHIGRKIPITRVIRGMLDQSGAGSTDLLVRTIGELVAPHDTPNAPYHGMRHIRQFMHERGFAGIGRITSMAYLDRYTWMLLDNRWAGVPAHALDAFRRNRITDYLRMGRLEVPGDGDHGFDSPFRFYRQDGMNHASPRAYTDFVAKIAKKSLCSNTARGELLWSQLKKASDGGAIEAGLPDATFIYAKSGSHHRTLCSVGTVVRYNGARSATIGVYTQETEVPDSAVLDYIARAAHLAWRALGFSHTLAAPTLPASGAAIVFQRPELGASFDAGDTPDIHWLSQDLEGRLRLQLVRTTRTGSDTVIRTISSNVVDDGEWHSFTVDDNLSPGTNYRFKLTSLEEPIVTAHSPFFSIGAVLRIHEPHLGEVHARGSKPAISWNSRGVTGRLTLRIEKRNDDFSVGFTTDTNTVTKTVSSRVLDDGSWTSWTVGDADVPYNSARIKLTANDHPGVVAWSPPFVLGPAIDVLTPTPGEVLDKGSKPVIRWASKGSPGTLRIELWRGIGERVLTITSRALDDGSFSSWTVPDHVPDGHGYQIRIADASNPRMFGLSHVFRIGAELEWMAPDLQQDTHGQAMVAANARPPFLKTGDRPVLRWRTIGAFDGPVELRLMRGSTTISTISSSTANDGVFSGWTVPVYLPPGSDYQFEVRSKNRPNVVAYSCWLHLNQYIDLWTNITAVTRPEVDADAIVPTILWWSEGLARNTLLTLYIERVSGSRFRISDKVRNKGEWTGYKIGPDHPIGFQRFILRSNADTKVIGRSPWFEVL